MLNSQEGQLWVTGPANVRAGSRLDHLGRKINQGKVEVKTAHNQMTGKVEEKNNLPKEITN